MKYLKDIPDIHDCDDAEYLMASELWKMPLRFINEKAVEDLYTQAKEDLTQERAGDLVSHLVACATLAEFLGLADHTQIKNFSIGSL